MTTRNSMIDTGILREAMNLHHKSCQQVADELGQTSGGVSGWLANNAMPKYVLLAIESWGTTSIPPIVIFRAPDMDTHKKLKGFLELLKIDCLVEFGNHDL
jgi:hypothetical protein